MLSHVFTVDVQTGFSYLGWSGWGAGSYKISRKVLIKIEVQQCFCNHLSTRRWTWRVMTLTNVILVPSSTSHQKKVQLPAERSKVTAVIPSIPRHIMEIKWGHCNDSAPHSPEVMRSKANNLSLGEMFQES